MTAVRLCNSSLLRPAIELVALTQVVDEIEMKTAKVCQSMSSLKSIQIDFAPPHIGEFPALR